jgi:hypothetical protein
MNIGLFEDHGWRELLPLTWLRACFELRCGCDRLIDKVRAQAGGPVVGMAPRIDPRCSLSAARDLPRAATGAS